MKISEKVQHIPLSILDLVRQIQSEPLKAESQHKIMEREMEISLQESKNDTHLVEIDKLERTIKNKTLNEQLVDYGKIERIKREIVDISMLKNELNRAKGLDFYYTVNDQFNPIYKVKRSKIMKMTDNSLFINKYQKGIQKRIKELKDNKTRTPKEDKLLFILKDKLLEVVKFNSLMNKFLQTDVLKLPKDFKGDVSVALNNQIPIEEKEGKYVISIDLSGATSIEF